jgi:hypothetical protein
MGDVLRPPVSPAKLVEGAFYRERGRVDRVKRVRRMGAGTRKGLKRASRCRTWLSWEMDGEGERGKVAKVEDRDDGWLARCARVGLSGPPEGEPRGGAATSEARLSLPAPPCPRLLGERRGCMKKPPADKVRPPPCDPKGCSGRKAECERETGTSRAMMTTRMNASWKRDEGRGKRASSLTRRGSAAWPPLLLFRRTFSKKLPRTPTTISTTNHPIALTPPPRTMSPSYAINVSRPCPHVLPACLQNSQRSSPPEGHLR